MAFLCVVPSLLGGFSLPIKLAADPRRAPVLDDCRTLSLSVPPLILVLFGCAPLVLCWLFGVPALAWLAAVEARAALGSRCVDGGRLDVVGDGSGGISVESRYRLKCARRHRVLEGREV